MRQMAVKVPNRFLGYAFCVGDLLLEMDLDFNIRNADGAVKTTLGIGSVDGNTTNFLDLLDARGRGLFKNSVAGLTGANRLGPVKLNVGMDADSKEQFGAFLAKLPSEPDSIYVVLSRPSRLGIDQPLPTATMLVEEKKQHFFASLEKLFEDDPGIENEVQVTVIEAEAGATIDGAQQTSIEQYLKSVSYGGKNASRVGEDKFAVVHEKANDNVTPEVMRSAVARATGIAISTATIDAAESHLSDKDSMRALVFSLQQFADGGDGFDVENIQQNCGSLIGETACRVRAFRQVLDEGAFSLVYQPIVDMKRLTTHHFEALTRFDLPEIMKSQWEMIRFAEDVGLIDDFDRAVINRVITKIRDLLRQGGAPGIAVNVSGRSMSDPDFISDLIDTLEKNVDIAGYLSLEITESARILDLKSLGEVVQQVRAIGFKVYLDDFGAGAAGFQYLKSLKVDAVKIDGAYIKDALESSEDRAFLRSMVMLCKDLGITTVGEWIETKEHAALLTEIGVDYGQGYFYGKPTNGLIAARVAANG